jgi:release factor glutamine methyltransferase
MVAALRAAGCVFAEEEAALLVARRVTGVPLEQILGWTGFCGLRILLDPGVFVPRQRTAFLVERAGALATAGAVVLDLCCGAGAVGAALASRLPGIELIAADIDPAAVRCARRNVPPGTRVFEGDLFDPLPAGLRGRIYLIVANTPYVPTGAIGLLPPEARDHEARIALDGGADGLDVQRRVAAEAPRWLAPGGHLLVETSEKQADLAAAIFAANGLMPTIAHSDELYSTVVSGRRPLDSST